MRCAGGSSRSRRDAWASCAGRIAPTISARGTIEARRKPAWNALPHGTRRRLARARSRRSARSAPTYQRGRVWSGASKKRTPAPAGLDWPVSGAAPVCQARPDRAAKPSRSDRVDRRADVSARSNPRRSRGRRPTAAPPRGGPTRPAAQGATSGRRGPAYRSRRAARPTPSGNPGRCRCRTRGNRCAA